MGRERILFLTAAVRKVESLNPCGLNVFMVGSKISVISLFAGNQLLMLRDCSFANTACNRRNRNLVIQSANGKNQTLLHTTPKRHLATMCFKDSYSCVGDVCKPPLCQCTCLPGFIKTRCSLRQIPQKHMQESEMSDSSSKNKKESRLKYLKKGSAYEEAEIIQFHCEMKEIFPVWICFILYVSNESVTEQAPITVQQIMERSWRSGYS